MAFWNKSKKEDTPKEATPENSEVKENAAEEISEQNENESVEDNIENNSLNPTKEEQGQTQAEAQIEQTPEQATADNPQENKEQNLPEVKKSRRELKKEEKLRKKEEKEAKKKRISGFSVFILILFVNLIWVAACVFYFFPMYNDDIWQRESQIEEYEGKLKTLQALYDNMSEEYELKIDELEKKLDSQQQSYLEAQKLIEKYENMLLKESQTDENKNSENLITDSTSTQNVDNTTQNKGGN